MTDEQRRIVEEQTKALLEGGAIVDLGHTEVLNSTYKAVSEYLDANKHTIVATENDADKIYAPYKELLKAHAKALSETRYKLTLSIDEFKFIKNTITRKLTYGRQDLFIALRVRDNFLEDAEFAPKADTATFPLDIDTITLISYLIGKYEHVGIDKTAENFASVVEKLGNVSRVYEHYNKKAEAVVERAQNWIAGLTPEQPVVSIPDAE